MREPYLAAQKRQPTKLQATVCFLASSSTAARRLLLFGPPRGPAQQARMVVNRCPPCGIDLRSDCPWWRALPQGLIPTTLSFTTRGPAEQPIELTSIAGVALHPIVARCRPGGYNVRWMKEGTVPYIYLLARP